MPTRGTLFSLSARYTEGDETYTPGTTSLDQSRLFKFHNWFDFKTTYDVFYKSKGVH